MFMGFYSLDNIGGLQFNLFSMGSEVSRVNQQTLSLASLIWSGPLGEPLHGNGQEGDLLGGPVLVVSAVTSNSTVVTTVLAQLASLIMPIRGPASSGCRAGLFYRRRIRLGLV